MAEKKIVDLPVSQTMSDTDSVFVSQNGSPVWVAFSKLKSLIKSFSGSYNDLTDKPTIPTKLSDLTADSTHRTVTDTEKSAWNAKANAFTLKTVNGESLLGSGNISITGGTGSSVSVDTTLSSTSTNPVQNKVIKAELDKKLNKTDYKTYSLPTATSTVLGGVKPVAKTSAMTKNVGVDANGALWAEPGTSGGSSETYELDAPKLIVDYTVTTVAKEYIFTTAVYPELAKAQYLRIIIEYQEKPTDQPWLVIDINDTRICGNPGVNNLYSMYDLYSLDGLILSMSFANDNKSYMSSNVGNTMLIPSIMRTAHQAIRTLAFKSYKDCLMEGTTIKVYGYY
jgi:hypothetical protein